MTDCYNIYHFHTSVSDRMTSIKSNFARILAAFTVFLVVSISIFVLPKTWHQCSSFIAYLGAPVLATVSHYTLYLRANISSIIVHHNRRLLRQPLLKDNVILPVHHGTMIPIMPPLQHVLKWNTDGIAMFLPGIIGLYLM